MERFPIYPITKDKDNPFNFKLSRVATLLSKFRHLIEKLLIEVNPEFENLLKCSAMIRKFDEKS